MILDDVRADNWRACTALEVEEPQQRFVASVAYYLALSYHTGNALAQSLYARMGFVETGELVDDETVARKRLK